MYWDLGISKDIEPLPSLFRRCEYHLYYLLTSKESLDQRTHHLLWGTGCTDVGQDEVTMSLLSIADPTCSQSQDAKNISPHVKHMLVVSLHQTDLILSADSKFSQYYPNTLLISYSRIKNLHTFQQTIYCLLSRHCLTVTLCVHMLYMVFHQSGKETNV